jgi:ribosomal protein S27E
MEADLPPKWDGVPVQWQGWSDLRSTLVYHLPVDTLACRQCGVVDEPLTNRGRRQFTYGVIVLQGSSALMAARCRHCGHDTVTDMEAEETWDLDEEDYGPNGSTASDVLF